ncbi:helix-turn-helix protein [Chromatocurvus halotolerans]|uniref:Helix-turn-helix protein n=2 Tax=Chromatocurvus halotolerans TaxID=1132028 RepID=A0A4R2L178_9GAMM|nr:helix-turn-helix protein [Chromatocurvus halotolerans]
MVIIALLSNFYYFTGMHSHLSALGQRLRRARRRHFPRDDLAAFALRIGVSRATLQKMEKGDLSVSMGRYHAAARVLGLAHTFDALLHEPASLFDDDVR